MAHCRGRVRVAAPAARRLVGEILASRSATRRPLATRQRGHSLAVERRWNLLPDHGRLPCREDDAGVVCPWGPTLPHSGGRLLDRYLQGPSKLSPPGQGSTGMADV